MNNFSRILDPYFDWLVKVFGDLAQEANRHNISPMDVAKAYLSHPQRRETFNSENVDSICHTVVKFWQENGASLQAELCKTPGMKAFLGGDIGPQIEDHIFERTGLYFDTLIVPDPLLRVASMPYEAMKTIDYYLLKYGITQVLLKDVYLADVYPPIAVLTPDIHPSRSETDFDEFRALAEVDSVIMVNELYNQHFDEFDQIQDFCSRFRSFEDAVKAVQKTEIFLWDENAPIDVSSQAEALLRANNIDWKSQTIPLGPAMLWFSVFGRMLQVNEVLRAAKTYSAHPIMTAPVSFHWLAQKVQANQKLLSEHLGITDSLGLGITNSLLSQDLQWLSNVPISALVDLRKRGALRDLRSVISQETDRLSSGGLENLEAVTKQVDYNLSLAFQRHQDMIRDLNESWCRDLAISGSTLLLSIGAALCPIPLLTTIGTIAGTSSLKDVIQTSVKYLKERRTLKKTPVGILWKARNTTR